MVKGSRTITRVALSVGAGLAAAGAVCAPRPVRAQDAADVGGAPRRPGGDAPVMAELDDRTRKAIDLGLRFLARRQEPGGAFVDGIGRKVNNTYGHDYGIQAFFQAGEPYWSRWYPQLRDELVSHQRPDGRWQDLVGPNSATAMAYIILQIPYRYLPIFER